MAVPTGVAMDLFLAMRTHMVLSKPKSVALLVLYAGFVVWMGLENFAVVDWVPQLPPETAPKH